MPSAVFTLRPEQAEDAAIIDDLHDLAFGPGRFVRTAQRLRDGIGHDPGMSFVATFGARVGGSVRLSPIRVGNVPGLLLGPLAVHPDFGNLGAGRALVRHALAEAKAAGWPLVLLVGDAPYYGPLGFGPTDPARVILPGPVDPRRVLAAELRPGILTEARGPVRGDRHAADLIKC